MWAMPVLAILPFWAIAYGGAFGERSTGVETPIQAGGALFATNCATCHGASGQGGVGPALAAVEKTFPDLKDHVSWVETGSKPFAGQTYGQGTRVATGGMPAFKDTLSATQIADIVCYERVTFGGGTEAKDCPAATAAPAG
jgi:mono/diheme cytochrome c family protein